MRCFAGLLAFALASMVEPCLFAQSPERNVEVLESFRVYGDGDCLIVPVTIQGKVYPFIVDTGATRTVFDISLQHLLGRRRGQARVEGAEEPVVLDCYTPPAAFLGKLPLPRKDVVWATDLSMLRHVVGEDIRGMLGMDFLRQYVVRLDFDRGILAIQKALGQEEGTPFPLYIDEKLKTPRIDAEVMSAGPPERFLLDTGYSRVTGALRVDTFDLLVSFGKLQEDGESDEVSLGHEGRKKNGRLLRLTLGPMDHRQLRFACSAQESKLGLGFLKRYRVILDFPGSRVYLHKGKRFDEPDEKDRSGLHLHRPAKETLVAKVDARSPAAKAGIEPGDALISVAELPADRSRLLVLAQRLCIVGATVPLTLKRNGSLLTVVLKLD